MKNNKLPIIRYENESPEIKWDDFYVEIVPRDSGQTPVLFEVIDVLEFVKLKSEVRDDRIQVYFEDHPECKGQTILRFSIHRGT